MIEINSHPIKQRKNHEGNWKRQKHEPVHFSSHSFGRFCWICSRVDFGFFFMGQIDGNDPSIFQNGNYLKTYANDNPCYQSSRTRVSLRGVS